MPEIESFRPLKDHELKILEWMFDHGSEDIGTYRPQIKGLLAKTWCDCGCPSIQLKTAEEASLGKQLNYAVIGDFAGKTSRGDLVGVLLFQRSGKLDLLEVYSIDGQAQGEFDLPTLESLSLLEWEPSPDSPNVRTLQREPNS